MGKISIKKRRKQKRKSGCLIYLLLVVLIVAGVFYGIRICKDILFPVDYEEIVTKYSNEYELDKYLVMAVIKTESGFIPDASSGKAMGLMQLTDDTGRWVSDKLKIKYNSTDLNNPEKNIRLGCYYLKYLMDYYQSIDVALAAYNGGMGNVDKWLKDKRYSDDGKSLKNIPFIETREYVQKVNKHWNKYKDMYGKE